MPYIFSMHVFILGTGRCGTTTFTQACGHLSNYTAGHETYGRAVGSGRFDYPDRHIEADNRLTWFLGELGRRYPDAFYVHLRRHREEVVNSFLHRWNTGSIIQAFAHQIVMHQQEWPVERRQEVCRFYVDTVTANIDQFLCGKRAMTMWLHEAPDTFPAFLDRIGAEGDLAAACAEWAVRHNATQVPDSAEASAASQGTRSAPAAISRPSAATSAEVAVRRRRWRLDGRTPTTPFRFRRS